MDPEALADQFRSALGIEGFPGWAGAMALAAYLGARVYVREGWTFALCRRRRDGTTSIWTPPDPWFLSHELGHVLYSPAEAGCIYLTSSPVGTVDHIRDEAAADRWARVWLLPRPLCRDASALEESGCPHHVIARRVRDLPGG